MATPLTIAIPKGRVLKALSPLFERAGLDATALAVEDRRLPLELGIGKCRMVVAGPTGLTLPEIPRVATKYARVATDHFAKKGVQAEVIYVQGSVELAPLVGLADVIVDLVESGATLRDNDLAEVETICPISSVLVANRSLYKLRHGEIQPLVERLRLAVEV
jgi:ATP phosphoribosyltransferase